MFFVFSTFVSLVDESLDAQSLQNILKVLLKRLFTILISKQDACFSFTGLTSSQLIFIKHASR